MPKVYNSDFLLINQSKEICEKQFSVFYSRGGQIRSLMHALPFNLFVYCGQKQKENFQFNVAFVLLNEIKILCSSKHFTHLIIYSKGDTICFVKIAYTTIYNLPLILTAFVARCLINVVYLTACAFIRS